MKKNISTKNTVLIIVILALVGLGYFYFSGTPQDSSAQLVGDEAASSPVSDEAMKIITLLNQTTSLRIDTTLFNSPVYKSLVDHTVPVVEQPVGKPNPFLYTVPVVVQVKK